AKAANSVTTSYSYTATPNSPADGSSETVFGTWQTLYLSGAVSYIRGAQNQITLNVAQSTDGDTSPRLVGTTSFTVDSPDQISLSQITLKEASGPGRAMVFYGTTLHRSGRKYVGNAEMADGDSQTVWRDFIRWVIEIEDNN